MPVIEFSVNGREQRLDVEADTPLLWVIREQLSLTGTKFGCGRGLCGACTVHLDGQPVRSCSFPVSLAAGKAVTTIEGIAADTGELHPVQQVWLEGNVPQCGYCQSGQIMAAVALLERKPSPTDEDIDAAMSNLCRCGTYPRIRSAVKRAVTLMENPVAYFDPREVQV